MPKFSPKLIKLLVIRGLARVLAPIAVLWGIYDWWLIEWWYAAIFGILTLNYVLVYVLSWIAPAAQNGPWRIRPWQTFVLIINAFLLPIMFNKTFGSLPWGFIAVSVLFFIGLYVATAIMFYLNEKLPMGPIFMAKRGGMIPTPPPKTAIPSTETSAS
ncbi:MAG: hypothetical protein JSV03_01660 [Planctomycetota bacterium]|nr:MAG: hypothetical protein JSV03_01660 [Planctomycetota bacterium]